jgi:signal transduction histidine kinase
MGTMSKLLDKPFKSFSLYALIILVCSIPVYYFAVDAIWIEELDEHNSIIRKRMELGIRKMAVADDELNQLLPIWNSLQPGTKLVLIHPNEVTEDRVYTTSQYNPLEQETDRYRVLSTTIYIQKKPYHLTISTNVEEADETIVAIAFVTVFFFVLLVLGFVFLNKRISRNSWKPFYKTLDQLKKFDLTKNQHIQLEQSDIEEFEELNRELTILIKKSALAFNQQKQFIENASHELQTPLAILKTKMDVLLQNEELNESQSSIINAINLNLSRISRITKNLLLLAKIENNQFSEKTTVNIREVLIETSELLRDYLENKGMQLHINVTNYEVSSNQTLVEVLFNNLLINAIRHGSINDVLHIELSGNKLTFSNNGNQGLNPDHLFVRFAISSAETTNSGLGLAISKEICDQYQWRISYAFRDQRHEFSIEF